MTQLRAIPRGASSSAAAPSPAMPELPPKRERHPFELFRMVEAQLEEAAATGDPAAVEMLNRFRQTEPAEE